jgi:integrase
LQRGGFASHLGDEARKDLVQRYGQFLNYCECNGVLTLSLEASALVTQPVVDGFIEELKGRVRATTVAGNIFKISRMARLLAPTRDFTWLTEIAKDLALVAEPLDKFPRVVMTERLVEVGLTLGKQAEISNSCSMLARSLMARNGLMIALLALRPIRLKNFSALRLGETFVQLEDSWWILLRTTKSKRPDERSVPRFLNDLIQQYLMVYRPLLLSHARNSDQPGANGARSLQDGALHPTALWVDRLGESLSSSQVARCISATTIATLGVDVSPHLFRAAFATTAAYHVPELPNLASAGLDHRHPSVVEEHYRRTTSLAAALDYAKIVSSL